MNLEKGNLAIRLLIRLVLVWLLSVLLLNGFVPSVHVGFGSTVVKFYLEPSENVFYTNETSVGDRFNVTAWVENLQAANIVAVQAALEFNETILNVTRWFEPTWDTQYIFYGRTTFVVPTPPKPDYVTNGSGIGRVRAGVCLFPSEQTPFGDVRGKVCIFEFNITAIPTEQATEITSALHFNDFETSAFDTNVVELEDIEQDGSYTMINPFVSGEIRIKADGSIDPPLAPVSTVDNVTYVLTADITNSSFVIERDNIVLDGQNRKVQGTGENGTTGIDVTGRNNVTIENVEIKAFSYTIMIAYSSNCTIIGNNITANFGHGVMLCSSSSNSVSGNSVSENDGNGIWLYGFFNNSIRGNNIANNGGGMWLVESSSNNISGNTITKSNYGVWLNGCSSNTVKENSIIDSGDGVLLNVSQNNSITGNEIALNNRDSICIWGSSNYNNISGNIVANSSHGIWLSDSSSYNNIIENEIANNTQGIALTQAANNSIYHNNFVNNTIQAYADGLTNTWDDGYPSGGNHWSDYSGTDLYRGPYQNETGSDCIGDTPYLVDTNNVDHYPVVNTWPPPAFELTIEASIGGTTDPPCGVFNYTAYSIVQATATPDTWYQFDHWELDYSPAGSANPITVLMNSHHNLKAIFLYTGSIYIRANGKIDPVTTPIYSTDNVTYTLTDNIYCSIVVERDSTVIDGADYTLQGVENGTGISLCGRNNVTIKNVEIRAFDVGIHVSGSSNCSIVGNYVTSNLEGIDLSFSSSTSLTGNSITDNDYGITLNCSSSNVFRNNVMANNVSNLAVRGLSLSDFDNDVDGSNTVDDKQVCYWVNERDSAVPSDAGCVILVNCTNITVKDLNLTKNGIVLVGTTNTTITGNSITASAFGGIWLWSSSDNSISGNNITNNSDGVWISSSSNITITENSIVANNECGVYLYFSSNSVISGNSVINNRNGIWLNFSSNGNTVIGNNLTANNGNATCIRSSSNNWIHDNDITDNAGYGVHLYESSNCNDVSENNITNNEEGVLISESSNNSIVDNNIASNQRRGILLGSAPNTTVIGNVVTNNGRYGVAIAYSLHDNITENSITNHETAGIVIVESSFNSIAENNITDCGRGIWAMSICYNSIIGNNITQIWSPAIWLDHSDGNNICENNLWGIYLRLSSNNSIYHNNFAVNYVMSEDSVNYWDGGYPCGGNYWNGFSGVDLYCGQYQNLTGSDGISDTAYSLDLSNVDNYPFMEPNGWQNHPISTETNATITDKTIRSTAMYFVVSGEAGHVGYVNATMPVGFNSTEIKVFIDAQPVQQPFPIITTNSTHYFIYFEFSLSTHDVTIQYAIADVAVTSITPNKKAVGQGNQMSINVTVTNKGTLAEVFQVSVYANTSFIASQLVTLSSASFKTVTFTWNTTDWNKGNYTINVVAEVVSGETYTSDNMLTGGTVYVGTPGDINADHKVDVKDVYAVARAYGTSLEGPNPSGRTYNPNCDINDDGKIDAKDYYTVCKHYGEVDQ
jgi:parallel beta-helix repeat protein